LVRERDRGRGCVIGKGVGQKLEIVQGEVLRGIQGMALCFEVGKVK